MWNRWFTKIGATRAMGSGIKKPDRFDPAFSPSIHDGPFTAKRLTFITALEDLSELFSQEPQFLIGIVFEASLIDFFNQFVLLHIGSPPCAK